MKLWYFHLAFMIPTLVCFPAITTFSKNESLCPSTNMKKFINRVIQENSHNKHGFLYVTVNEVEPEYSDFVLEKIYKSTTAINVNFYLNRNTDSLVLSPSHFKFAIVDPEGDISYAAEIFRSVRTSRARILLILTKKPLPIFVDYILNTYWQIQCVNVIVAYESEGKVEIVTYNPYLSSTQRVEKLTDSGKDLYYDKTRNLYGSRVRGLLTFRDRTKVKKVYKGGEVFYEGKDFLAISTLFAHINAKLEIVHMDNVILNPFFESLIIGNRTERQMKVLKDRDITVLVKSERFTDNDGVVDNLYPHSQNDLKCLVPKSSEIPMAISTIMTYTPTMWVINAVMLFAVFFTWMLIKKFLGNTVDFQKHFFDVFRLSIANSIASFPRHSLERMLILSWLASMYINNVFIQSKITSYLAIRKYHPEIDTIEDLISSGLPLYSISIHIEELKKKYVGTQYEQYTNSIIPLASNEGFMDQMFYRTDVTQMPAFLSENDIAVFISRGKNFRQNGAQRYHMVKESIIPNYQSYKVVHNSPLLPILNKILRRLEEGGFIDLWARGAIHNATVEGFLYPEDYDNTKNIKSLSLDVTLIWVYILLAGYILSIFTFILEIIYRKNSKIIFLN